MNDPELFIYETFSSIQGESSYAGIPCFFIRLAGCPLNCAWCDTRKARDIRAGNPCKVSELIRLAQNAGIPLVEVTGGEPLAQKETPFLCSELLRNGFQVLIETNGAADVSVLPEGVIRILDMKTPSSGESQAMLEKNFRSVRPCDEVKFVIQDRADYDFAVEAVKRFALEDTCGHVLFSPAAGSMDPALLTEWILNDHLRVRINLQFHKIIWGPDREGV